MAFDIDLTKRQRLAIRDWLEPLTDPAAPEFDPSEYRDAVELLELIREREPLPRWAVAWIDGHAADRLRAIRSKLQIRLDDLHELQALENLRAKIETAAD